MANNFRSGKQFFVGRVVKRFLGVVAKLFEVWLQKFLGEGY